MHLWHVPKAILPVVLQCRVSSDWCAPLSKEHGLHGAPHHVNLNSLSDDGPETVDIEWGGIPATLDGLSIPQVYDKINLRVQKKPYLYAFKTRHDMTFTGVRTAAY